MQQTGSRKAPMPRAAYKKGQESSLHLKVGGVHVLAEPRKNFLKQSRGGWNGCLARRDNDESWMFILIYALGEIADK